MLQTTLPDKPVRIAARPAALRPQPAGRTPRWLAPAKALAFAAGLYPLARLVVLGFSDGLGANPVEFVTRSSGLWTLVFLCVTLAVTPARRLTGIGALMRFRRMIGLFAFFYATLHFITYLWFDQWFDVAAIAHDVVKRPFITVGFAAFVLLIPLAATSPRAVARRLGRHWQRLHRAVYAIAVLAILHFWWMRAGKHDLAQPELYGAIVLALLVFRLLAWSKRY
ncbi:protein-methionine-sulfoxide reductase heme-binding subunit MsrQ (plasmid) [Burkholderia thailandensis]|uniref:protein-methionine-sulfoxide reductase heme-binding subunit MsrQ n=1 Tax=Burkholderia thailandensis TaxID=57975 RepID=UPI00192DA032|nr:protein-methionine-sulfoxide reductase heme-binding subunit MsrQ [Burkholderia thailandensis]MBS2132258.1 protein-methionine-sulfoxide reductase heme-binding subunit MsrQ [Burkholderia thailandensis]QRA15349.1 protein-methionine-sulfoxide reductase heme-binding subunit MsrQ [Burkholderia thailandensis]